MLCWKEICHLLEKTDINTLITQHFSKFITTSWSTKNISVFFLLLEKYKSNCTAKKSKLNILTNVMQSFAAKIWIQHSPHIKVIITIPLNVNVWWCACAQMIAHSFLTDWLKSRYVTTRKTCGLEAIFLVLYISWQSN